MTDREEFSFEKETSPSGTESAYYTVEHEVASESPGGGENGRKGSMRILLLVLLLVAVGAAGFSFQLGTEEAEPPPPSQVAVNKQPIAVPTRPVQEPPPAAKESTLAAEEALQVPAQETATPPEEKTQPQIGMAVVQADSGGMPAISSPDEVSEPPALAKANYTIAAGAFLLRSNLAGAERKVTESGFEPQVVQKMQWMDMTRLRVGVFSPEEGKKKMEELEELTTNAFYLPADGKVAVYAGSFQNLDKARSFADRLYKQGLRVEEESAHVEVPLYLLSFGGFDDLESAREAAERVRTAGLDAMVVKNP